MPTPGGMPLGYRRCTIARINRWRSVSCGGVSSGHSIVAVWIGPVSSTSITRTRIGRPGGRLLAMTAPAADRGNLQFLRRRNAHAVARPGFRQLPTLAQQVAAAIGALHVVADTVRQR